MLLEGLITSAALPCTADLSLLDAEGCWHQQQWAGAALNSIGMSSLGNMPDLVLTLSDFEQIRIKDVCRNHPGLLQGGQNLDRHPQRFAAPQCCPEG